MPPLSRSDVEIFLNPPSFITLFSRRTKEHPPLDSATASGSSQVPVEITAIEVGRGERGREMISLGSIFCRHLRELSHRVGAPAQAHISTAIYEYLDKSPYLF